MHEFSCESVADRYKSYPDDICRKLMYLRNLIFDTASELTDVCRLEETLKWGEPSFLVKGGSTVRVGWNERKPDHYGMYFNCNSKLIDTFRELYSDALRFEGNRAIVFHLNDEINEAVLKHCIALSLRYHKLKKLPLLGA